MMEPWTGFNVFIDWQDLILKFNLILKSINQDKLQRIYG